jgi:WD40 repeat protein
MFLNLTNAKRRSSLQHTPKILIIGLCLLFMAGCSASPLKLTATPTAQIKPGVPTAEPVLKTILQFWIDTDFKCWTAPAAHPTIDTDVRPGHLLLAAGDQYDNLAVYQFDFATSQYTRLLQGILQLPPSSLLPLSPDGQYLWYGVRERGNIDAHYPSYTDTIHIYSLLDGKTRLVPFITPAPYTGRLQADGEFIRWSPDSTCLILWVENTAIAYRLADGAIQQKVFPGTYITSSPTGRLWIWNATPNIGFMRLISDTPTSIQLGQLKVDDTLYDRLSMFHWSNDGQTLAIVYALKGTPYIYDRIRLVHFTNDQVDAYQDISVFVTNLQWSPNNRYLLIAAGLDANSATYPFREVYRLFDQVTGNMTEFSSPLGYSSQTMQAWSPTSDQIAFVAADDHSLYVMNVNGTNEKPLPAIPTGGPISYLIWTR